jgi:hypothetical protein
LKFVQIKGQVLFKGEIITKMGWGHLKIFFSRIAGPKKLKFTRKLSDILVKIMAPGVGWGHNRGNCFYQF